MKIIDTKDKKTITKQLDQLVNEQIAKPKQAALQDFIERVLSSAYTQEFEGRRVSDVFGYFVSMWKVVSKRTTEATVVTIENPGLEVDGWQSPHTVITVAMKNIPFLVDSLRIALADKSLRVQGIQHTILYCERDKDGTLKKLLKRSDKNADQLSEALLCIEVDRITSEEQISQLKAHIDDVLDEVSSAVDDFKPMLERVDAIREGWAKNGHAIASKEELAEASEFMHWLGSNSFTFLGYVEYELKGSGSNRAMVRDEKTALGVLKRAYKGDEKVVLKDVPARTRDHILEPSVFLFAKSSRRSRVHRPAYADYIVVKKFNAKGEVIGECRFFGLYTARVFSDDLNKVPLLREKVAKARELSGYDIRDHSGKEYEQLMNAFPRDELFQVSAERLHEAINSALYAQERRKVSIYLEKMLSVALSAPYCTCLEISLIQTFA